MMANAEVTAPYGFVAPDPESGPRVCPSVAAMTAATPLTSVDDAPDTKRTPELELPPHTEMLPQTPKVPPPSGRTKVMATAPRQISTAESRYPDTVDESVSAPPTASISSFVSSIASSALVSAPVTSSMMLSSIAPASHIVLSGADVSIYPSTHSTHPTHPTHPTFESPVFVPTTGAPTLDPAHPLLLAALSMSAPPHAAPPSSPSSAGMVYAPALGSGSVRPARRPGAVAAVEAFVAALATTPAQRAYVLVTTATIGLMSTLILVLAFARIGTSAHAQSPSAAPAGGGASTIAGTTATAPPALCAPLPPDLAAATAGAAAAAAPASAPAEPTGAVARAAAAEVADPPAPTTAPAPTTVARNARRGAAAAPRSPAPTRR